MISWRYLYIFLVSRCIYLDLYKLLKSISKTFVTVFFIHIVHRNLTCHLLHLISFVSFKTVNVHKLEFDTENVSGRSQNTSVEGSSSSMSSYSFIIEGVISAADANVTSHCQLPMCPKTSVVTSSWTVPILKGQNVILSSSLFQRRHKNKSIIITLTFRTMHKKRVQTVNVLYHCLSQLDISFVL